MCVPSCACRPSVRKSLSCSSRYTCWTSLASLISKLPTRVPLYCATCVCPTRLSCVTIDVRLGVGGCGVCRCGSPKGTATSLIQHLCVLSRALAPTRGVQLVWLSRRVRRAPPCSHREAARAEYSRVARADSVWLIRPCACACACAACALNAADVCGGMHISSRSYVGTSEACGSCR